jgi:DNA-binding protein Fis
MRWSALVTTPERIFPVELSTSRPSVVGRGRASLIDLNDPGVAERHLSLVVRDDGVVVELLRGGGEVRLNEVHLSASTVLRAGDCLSLGASSLTIVAHAETGWVMPTLLSGDALMTRLRDELERAGARRLVCLVLVNVPALNVAARQVLLRRVMEAVAGVNIVASWGEVTSDLLGVVLPEVEKNVLTALETNLPAVAGPRAKVAFAMSRRDGFEADALLEAAFERLIGPVQGREPVLVDPVMVRLASVAAGARLPLLVYGPSGSGRATLARFAAAVQLEVNAGDSVALEAALEAEGPVLVREVSRLERSAVDALLARAGARLLATADRPVAGFASVIEVPGLSARREDILPLAEQFLSEARIRLGRPKLMLGPEARQALASWRWPGNVRELRNVMVWAAKASVRDEVGPDALPARLSAQAPADDFRGALRSAERELLLEALARTQWNVTAAAARLGLARRTVVFRMSKLGLKRPAR